MQSGKYKVILQRETDNKYIESVYIGNNNAQYNAFIWTKKRTITRLFGDKFANMFATSKSL